ncbi:hypothetical protein EDC96DRAFT_550018 [Choanephora cucurbitarum]|nr:hypothetical protein EDC96DRAFT_550018 [Choanephora cucurbitarum]
MSLFASRFRLHICFSAVQNLVIVSSTSLSTSLSTSSLPMNSPNLLSTSVVMKQKCTLCRVLASITVTEIERFNCVNTMCLTKNLRVTLVFTCKRYQGRHCYIIILILNRMNLFSSTAACLALNQNFEKLHFLKRVSYGKQLNGVGRVKRGFGMFINKVELDVAITQNIV